MFKRTSNGQINTAQNSKDRAKHELDKQSLSKLMCS